MTDEGQQGCYRYCRGQRMGAGATHKMAAGGFRIAVLSSPGKGEVLAKELNGIGYTSTNQLKTGIQSLVDKIMVQWGRIDVLVNSAGHGPRGAVLEITDEDWHLGLETYFLNVVQSTRLVTPIMQQ